MTRKVSKIDTWLSTKPFYVVCLWADFSGLQYSTQFGQTIYLHRNGFEFVLLTLKIYQEPLGFLSLDFTVLHIVTL